MSGAIRSDKNSAFSAYGPSENFTKGSDAYAVYGPQTTEEKFSYGSREGYNALHQCIRCR